MAETKKYQIVSARVEQASGGPDAAILVAEVELKPVKGAPFFYTLVECEGMPMIYKTETSVFDWWMEPDAYESELDDLQDAGSVSRTTTDSSRTTRASNVTRESVTSST